MSVSTEGGGDVFRMPVATTGEVINFKDVECLWSSLPWPQVQVRFQYKGRSWNRLFELKHDKTVLGLKCCMTAANVDEAAWFDLYSLGRRLGEKEMLQDGQVLDFWFTPPGIAAL